MKTDAKTMKIHTELSSLAEIKQRSTEHSAILASSVASLGRRLQTMQLAALSAFMASMMLWSYCWMSTVRFTAKFSRNIQEIHAMFWSDKVDEMTSIISLVINCKRSQPQTLPEVMAQSIFLGGGRPRASRGGTKRFSVERVCTLSSMEVRGLCSENF